jgi:hypothetical protein
MICRPPVFSTNKGQGEENKAIQPGSKRLGSAPVKDQFSRVKVYDIIALNQGFYYR